MFTAMQCKNCHLHHPKGCLTCVRCHTGLTPTSSEQKWQTWPTRQSWRDSKWSNYRWASSKNQYDEHGNPDAWASASSKHKLVNHCDACHFWNMERDTECAKCGHSLNNSNNAPVEQSPPQTPFKATSYQRLNGKQSPMFGAETMTPMPVFEVQQHSQHRRDAVADTPFAEEGVVKLTEIDEAVCRANYICIQYNKGRCSRGTKCRFAHDMIKPMRHQPNSVTGGRICANCRFLNTTGAVHCINCGFDLAKDIPSTARPAASPSEERTAPKEDAGERRFEIFRSPAGDDDVPPDAQMTYDKDLKNFAFDDDETRENFLAGNNILEYKYNESRHAVSALFLEEYIQDTRDQELQAQFTRDAAEHVRRDVVKQRKLAEQALDKLNRAGQQRSQQCQQQQPQINETLGELQQVLEKLVNSRTNTVPVKAFELIGALAQCLQNGQQPQQAAETTRQPQASNQSTTGATGRRMNQKTFQRNADDPEAQRRLNKKTTLNSAKKQRIDNDVDLPPAPPSSAGSEAHFDDLDMTQPGNENMLPSATRTQLAKMSAKQARTFMRKWTTQSMKEGLAYLASCKIQKGRKARSRSLSRS